MRQPKSVHPPPRFRIIPSSLPRRPRFVSGRKQVAQAARASVEVMACAYRPRLWRPRDLLWRHGIRRPLLPGVVAGACLGKWGEPRFRPELNGKRMWAGRGGATLTTGPVVCVCAA